VIQLPSSPGDGDAENGGGKAPGGRRRSPGPPLIKRVRPKTYSVAVYLVGAVLLLELAMFVLVFWLRAMVVTVDVRMPRGLAGHLGGPSAFPSNGVANSGPPKPNPDFPSLPSLEIKGAHPGLLKVPDASDQQEQVLNLNQEAQVFLHQNDYQSAADLLVRAEDIDPRHPTTLKNLAETYNLMNDLVHSKAYWQRLVDLGPGVGTVYASAKDHVLLMDSGRDANPLKDPSPLPRQIYIDTVEKTPVETSNGDAQFHVRAVLSRKDPTMPNFDQKKLQPYVIFYQQMRDGSLIPDLGQRKGSFDDTFLFWGNKLKEAFGVDYIMPIPGTPGPNNTTQGKYYGFVIGIYYDKMLQDVRAEPADLAQRMPLPQEIE
jgi:tetratricopeptide (TPR) repeat protein